MVLTSSIALLLLSLNTAILLCFFLESIWLPCWVSLLPEHVPFVQVHPQHVPATYNCWEHVPACYNCREHVPATYNCWEHVLNGIKVRVFCGKKVEKKHLCRHDKNYYYFWKSNIPVINLIEDSRNMIKVSKNKNL